MKKYRYLIFDADHTLISFDEDERRAFRTAFDEVGMIYDDAAVEACWRYSAHNWNELGLNDVHKREIYENYHLLYHEHIRSLFDWVERNYSLPDRERAVQTFERTLGLPSHPIEGALEAVKILSESYKICIATNGLTFLQHGRLREFEPYLTKKFISEEMGYIKPQAEYYRVMFSELGATADECLMIGDSLSSDVAGANGVNMDAVWYNPAHRPLPDGVKILFEIDDFSTLVEKLSPSSQGEKS